MDVKAMELQVKIFSEQWEKLLLSNKLNICTEQLEGATILDVNILKVVGKKQDIILREVSKLLNIPSSTLTSAINRLEKRKLLKRVISERDLRSFGLSLTEEGRRALEEHYKLESKLIESMLNIFEDSEERDTFVRLFKKLIDNMI